MSGINVILATMTGRTMCVTKTVYQYNQGMILKLLSIDLPQAYTVDFANSVSGQSISQVGGADGVTIPDQFFVPGSTIYAWVVLTGTGYAVTRYQIMIPISPRAVRTSEEPTPSQQSALDEAIAALNTAVSEAEAAVQHYPKVEDGVWMVWDVTAGEYVSTGVAAQGPQGAPGQDGTDGTDGYSPTVTVTDIIGGHRITITDADGTKTVDVMDGTDGDDGIGISSVVKTGTSGLVDTYTITYTDGTTSTFTVTNGEDGVTFTPSVSTAGVISWTNDGGRQNPQSVDIKGPPGATPQMSIGTVETLSPGSSATASITGTDENPVLNLGLPQGGVDLGLQAATVGQIAKITAVDTNGVPTAWEPADVYPKKVFDYTYEGNWYHINVTAIDYENGILTLEPNEALFTDDPNTTVRIAAVYNLGGKFASYKYGNMPAELHADATLYGVSAGENQIKVYTTANGGSYLTFTQNDHIDLGTWQIFAELTRNRGVNSVRVGDLLSNHDYKAVMLFPRGMYHFVSGIDFQKSSGSRIQSSYGGPQFNGYYITFNGMNANSIGAGASDTYALATLRGTHFNLPNAIKQAPFVALEATLRKVNSEVRMSDVKLTYGITFSNPPKPHDIFSTVTAIVQVCLNTNVSVVNYSTGNANTMLDDTRCVLYDMGVN